MTYPIANVVFGFPYSKEIRDAYVTHLGRDEEGPDEFIEDEIEAAEGEVGWNFLYSASPLDFEPIGYFGEELFSDAYWEMTLCEYKPTPEQAERVWQAYMKLPDPVQKVSGEPKVCLVWSDS